MDVSFWFALTSLFVAAGGLAVAIIGSVSNARAIQREEADRKEQIEGEWAREWAAQRPVVYPVALPEWAYASEGSPYRSGNSRVLPIKNGGRGPALNVRGVVYARSSDGTTYEREILAGTIAAGDLLDARLVPHPGVQHWIGARGSVKYSDLAQGEWETQFDFTEGPGGEIVVTAHEPKIVSRPETSAE